MTSLRVLFFPCISKQMCVCLCVCVRMKRVIENALHNTVKNKSIAALQKFQEQFGLPRHWLWFPIRNPIRLSLLWQVVM